MARLPIFALISAMLPQTPDRVLRMALRPQQAAPHVPPAPILNRKQRRAAKKKGGRR